MTTSTFPASSSNATTSAARAAPLVLGPATVRWTGRADGDLGLTASGDVGARRRAVHPGSWAWLRQVHGTSVHRVDAPGAVQGADGDALVTAASGVVLAVFTADCAPVAFASDEGVVGLAHAGWRGAEAGILAATTDAMRGLGATKITAALGPCIHPGCYAFGAADLERLARRFGDGVRGVTAAGDPALDLPAVVAAALAEAEVELAVDAGECTACSTAWFSHRARQESQRQATVVVHTGGRDPA